MIFTSTYNSTSEWIEKYKLKFSEKNFNHLEEDKKAITLKNAIYFYDNILRIHLLILCLALWNLKKGVPNRVFKMEDKLADLVK